MTTANAPVSAQDAPRRVWRGIPIPEPMSRIDRRYLEKPAATTFGKALDAIRGRQGLSQTDLADRAEIDHSMISRCRSGERTPSRETVERLADALDASPTDRARLLITAGYVPQGYEAEVLAFVQSLAMTRGEG